MCGIAGLLQLDAARDGIVLEQLRCLHHRGPDAAGHFTRGAAAIGQTRLSIIDLETGNPPITNEDGSIGVVLNGEIYNYAAIRAELAQQGHTFATAGDTEVIAHLAEFASPIEIARRLDGMFAFAVWDTRRQQVVLGRDRLGKKPLYYFADGRVLVFGSELKALLAHPAVPRRLEPTAISSYLTFGYVPSPRTFYEGIRSVPPGHVLVADSDLRVSVEPYWQPEVPRPGGPERLDVGLREAAKIVRDGLDAAVERRLVADVPVGAFLSGGVDSSAVVALMAGKVNGPVPTFTIGFEDGEGFDERPYARRVAELFGTDHTELVVHPDVEDLVERLVWHHDQPFGDSSAIPTYLLSELTAQSVKVALCGDGGDELFGGYERFRAGMAVDQYSRAPLVARRAAERLVDTLPPGALRGRVGSAQRFARRAGTGLPDAFRSWLSYVDEDRRHALLPDASDEGLQDYERAWARSAGAHTLDRLLDLNLRTYLVDDLLPKVDRMGMAHALEVRAPFLDHHLVETALRLPPETKIHRLTLKRVLKEAVADLLPADILHRRKRGFGVPLDRWFRTDLKAFVDGMLGQPSARVRQHLVPDELDRLLQDHQHGASHGHAIWALLTLEIFLRREGW